MEKMTFKKGDEIWWFQSKKRADNYLMCFHITPDTIELVHDVVTDIQDNILICWHGSHNVAEVWGKSRQEAWNRLKNELTKWGELE